MENKPLYQTEGLSYPGSFVPLINEEEVAKALSLLEHPTIVTPPVNIVELGHSYKIEIAIPGIQRESLLLQGAVNVLSILVLNIHGVHPAGENYQVHEFDYECFSREIILPENADLELAYAGYSNGILSVHVPKTASPSNKQHINIMVY
jgi:HSP20 family protein